MKIFAAYFTFKKLYVLAYFGKVFSLFNFMPPVFCNGNSRKESGMKVDFITF